MSLVAELATAFMKPENVVAAIVYGDGTGNYFGDVVLKKGTRLLPKRAHSMAIRWLHLKRRLLPLDSSSGK